MSATLRVTHELNFGIELRRGQFEVLVDGKTVGSVEIHDTLETPLAHATTIGKNAPRNTRNVAGLSPIPKKIIATGIHAIGLIGRSISSTGLTV